MCRFLPANLDLAPWEREERREEDRSGLLGEVRIMLAKGVCSDGIECGREGVQRR